MKDRDSYEYLVERYGEPIYTYEPDARTHSDATTNPLKYAVFLLDQEYAGGCIVYAKDKDGWYANPVERKVILHLIEQRKIGLGLVKRLEDNTNAIKALFKYSRRNLYALGIAGAVLAFALSGLGIGGLIAALAILGCAYLVEYLLP